jgi:hypothetical protein
MHDHDFEALGHVHKPAMRKPAEAAGSSGPATADPRAPLTPTRVMSLQRAAGNSSVSGLIEEERSPVHDVVGKGGGQPLDTGTRSFMEERIGADFSGVRVHTDGKAAESAKAVQAHAYTVGNDVVFGAGQYQPGSPSAQRMLAHELTHVVQQRSGPVSGTPQAGGINVSDPSDSFERAAEANADKVMSGGPAQQQPTAAPSVQREEADDDEYVQEMAVQRAEDEDEMQDEDL